MIDTLRYEDVNVHPAKGGWVTTEVIKFMDLVIPIGFFFNGANIPRMLWSLIAPNDPSTMPGYLVHDYLCGLGQYIKADNYLEKILVSSDVKMWKRKAIMVGVRAYTSIGRPITNGLKNIWTRLF